jgi:hypothetical protein
MEVDMDIVLTEKDKKMGAKVQRPVPRRNKLPFGGHSEESTMFFFLVYWYVLFYELTSHIMVTIIVYSLVYPCICRSSLFDEHSDIHLMTYHVTCLRDTFYSHL